MRKTLALLLLIAATALSQPTLKIASSTPQGMVFEAPGAMVVEIVRNGKLVASLPGDRSGRFTWKDAARAPHGAYLARLSDGTRLSFHLPVTKADLQAKSVPPPVATPKLSVRQTPTGLNLVYQTVNLNKVPLTVYGSGRGGRLTISRGSEVVATLDVPGLEDSARRVVPPGQVVSQTIFPWPAAATAPPGEYTARMNGVELNFRLPYPK